MRAVVVAALALVSTAAQAQTNNLNFFQAIPTLDEVGLGALIALVAGVAGWILRRKHK